MAQRGPVLAQQAELARGLEARAVAVDPDAVDLGLTLGVLLDGQTTFTSYPAALSARHSCHTRRSHGIERFSRMTMACRFGDFAASPCQAAVLGRPRLPLPAPVRSTMD
jgi:hypothetical protein